MKKQLISTLALVIFTLCVTFLFSCKEDSKELLPEPTPKTNSGEPTDNTDPSITTRSLGLSVSVSIQNGRLIFGSAEDFETGMNEINEMNTLDWNNSQGFNSMWKQLNLQLTQEELDDLDELPIMDDETLLGVLNPNGIVQINPWIFKLNGTNRTVYVLPVSKISKINLLNNEIPVDPDILTFSFDDDVFYELETGSNPAGGCNLGECAETDVHGDDFMQQYCSGVDANKNTVKYKRKGKVSYRSGGIWKVMKMKFKHEKDGWGGDDETTFGFIYQFFYQNKCGDTGSGTMTEADHLHPITGALIYNVWHDNKHVQKFYSGIRCLINYSVGHPADYTVPAQVIHLDQCLIDAGLSGNVIYEVGNISGT